MDYAERLRRLVINDACFAGGGTGGTGVEPCELDPKTPDMDRAVEEGKKAFAGFEQAGQTLGVIGLGKVGCLVADAAIKLGMNVLGYDPHITVEAAWGLPSSVKRAASVEEVLKASHFVSLHIPLTDKTRHTVGAKNIEITTGFIGVQTHTGNVAFANIRIKT